MQKILKLVAWGFNGCDHDECTDENEHTLSKLVDFFDLTNYLNKQQCLWSVNRNADPTLSRVQQC